MGLLPQLYTILKTINFLGLTLYADAHTHTHLTVCMYVCVCVCVCVCVYTWMYMHIHIYTHIQYLNTSYKPKLFWGVNEIMHIKHITGSQGGSVGWVANSWFWLRSWSYSYEIEPWVRLHAECWACLRFSAYLSLCPSFSCIYMCMLSLSLSQEIKKKGKHIAKSLTSA